MLQIQRRCIQQRSTTLKETTHRRLIKPTSRPITLDRTHTRPKTTTTNMPLVVPGLQSKDGDKSSNWMEKLVGKKIGDSSNETTFAKTDLPKQHRIVKEGDMMTMDHNPDRMNIHTGEDGTVQKVTHG
ncbi:hypothetical protein TI39_contig633g00008 [Zymoseptoria brevis]|uniref:Uncharacterized protein n=4 Tax=Zymoseptoria TaxID=1047167 RepID=A0A0F4GGJ3_9PEZI|nr:hypothetical protein TI39_contig633g00008 [Zymoseptoria brevis]